MQAVTYSAFRRDLKSHMRRCRDDADTILVTNNDPSENVVVMSQRDYDSWAETLRIYENPYLYEKIRRGMREFREGGGAVHELVDEDAHTPEPEAVPS